MAAPRWTARAALALALAIPAGGVARAGDAPEARGPVEVRVYPVGALLRAHPRFSTDRGPGAVSPDMVNDEDHPLYGDEHEGVSVPLGCMEGLTDALRATAGEPGDWDAAEVETVGVGESLLLVRGPVRLHEAIGVRLAAWARDACTTLVADVALFEGDADAAGAVGGLPAAVAAGTLRPLGIARVLPSTHGTGTARDGARFAFLQDYDTEVGCSCNVPDPIIGVVPQGLAVQVVALPSGGGRWLVRTRGFWAADPVFSVRRMQGGRWFIPYEVGPRVPVPPGGDAFEAVSARGLEFEVPLSVEEGVWTPVALSGRRALAVRLRSAPPDADTGFLPAGALPRIVAAPRGPGGLRATSEAPTTWRSFRVGDLLEPVRSGYGTSFRVFPSHYCPEWDPELPEPKPAITGDALRWILERTLVADASDGADEPFHLRSGRLAARADAARIATLESLLSGLRADLLRRTEVEASVVTLPLASLPEVWSDPDAVAAAGLPALLARPGARLVDTVGLELRDGQRLAVVAGAERTFLKDYDVELACTTTIGNPIVQPLRTGLSLDVRADRVLSSPLVSLLVRFDRGVLRGSRSLPTRFGAIEAPSMHEQVLRGAITLAPGETRLFGLSSSGPEATLVLLSLAR